MFVKWAQLPFFLVDAEDKLQCCDFSNVSDDRIDDSTPFPAETQNSTVRLNVSFSYGYQRRYYAKVEPCPINHFGSFPLLWSESLYEIL